MRSRQEVRPVGVPADQDPTRALQPERPARPWEVPVLALVCALLWGSAFPAIKFVYREWGGDVSLPVRLAFSGFRFMLAGLLLVPLRGNPLVAVRRDTWAKLAALAATQTFLQYLFFYSGLAVAGGVLGALLVSAGSFWWVLLAPLVLKSPAPTRRQWLALLACAAGMAVAVWRPGAGSGDTALGTALFLASSLAGAAGAVTMAALGPGVRATHATSLSLFAGGAVLALFGAGGWAEFWRLLDLETGLTTLYLAGVSASAFALWNSLVQRHSANVLAGYRFLIPLCGIVLSAALIPGETVGAGTVLGGAVVIGALALVNRRPR